MKIIAFIKIVARINCRLQRMKHAGDIMRAGEEFLPMRILLAGVHTKSGKEDYLWTQEQETRRIRTSSS